MATIPVKDANFVTVELQVPLAPGRAAAADSRPIALSTEDKAALDAIGTVLATPTDLTLLTSAAATGSSVAVTAGRFNWTAYGTWDGATAQLQWSPNSGTTWINFDNVAATANGGYTDIPVGAGHVRVLISGAGGTTSISSKLSGVP